MRQNLSIEFVIVMFIKLRAIGVLLVSYWYSIGIRIYSKTVTVGRSQIIVQTKIFILFIFSSFLKNRPTYCAGFKIFLVIFYIQMLRIR
jgi:hypothetical protein